MRLFNEIISSFKPSRPVFRATKRYSREIALEPINEIETSMDISDPLVSFISSSIRQEFDGATLKNVINTSSALASIKYELTSTFCSFIELYSDFSNPRLSALYQWYKQVPDRVGTYEKHPEMLDQFMQIYRYLMSKEHMKGSAHTMNCLKLLNVVKTKYEGKGLCR